MLQDRSIGRTIEELQGAVQGLHAAVTALVMDEDALLTEGDVAEILRLEVRTISKWRERDDGPPFVKYGKSVRYQRNTLREWMKKNTFRSTTEAQG